ncbi:asparagine synthase (glutamine-hydrolyzing) [Sabulicella glaciei]|uniref:asparagine synthase (glutamine-hydrolyzing) n=1 Tax=Sabulicella glaciei TaxID=2984948 RepID=A0ABT3NRL7_9PROT|nr:asparagine synthase (glutamine-hydrolyzing) [Roseococcus sp. MDT2-1-1]MCW8084798.1 asparagine synthase (glutamine-hydrolyzing) [Roseococcus sp. MDT2-1-1]
MRRMADALAHRGPDGDGFHVEPHLGFGHRRLSFVDLEGGSQPMTTADGAVLVTFNGEIYNHVALREALEAAGHLHRTRSDTEILLTGWREWGVGLLDRLQGMYAFALWDRTRSELLLARDRMGEKPLHWTVLPDGTLAFASEIPALLTLPGVDRRTDPMAIEDFLALGYIPDPATGYAAIRRLPAAHFALLRRGEAMLPEPRSYWRPPTRAVAGSADAAAELRARLTDAVHLQLMADVPIGAFLSGGVDSASVVALASRKVGLSTFTIGFSGPGDERPAAASLAARFGTTHHAEEGEQDYLAAASRVAEVYGEPFGDHSAVPSLAVSRLARRHVKGALSGDGGDEVLGGYRRHRFHSLVEAVRANIPPGMRRAVIGRLAAWYPNLAGAPRWLRAKSTLTELSLDSALGYYGTVCKLRDARRQALLSPRLRTALEGHSPSRRFVEAMDEADPDDPLLAAQRTDILTYLPGDILVKTDRASMAHSLELRAPFLDHNLVEWGLALPAREKLRGAFGKHVLRRAMAQDLPHDLLWARKRGFAAEIAGQFRRRAGEIGARLRRGALGDSGLLELGEAQRLVAEHEAGAADHSQPIWQILVLEAWLAREAGLAPAEERAAA